LASNGLYKEAADVKKLAQMIEGEDEKNVRLPDWLLNDKEMLNQFYYVAHSTFDRGPLQAGEMSEDDRRKWSEHLRSLLSNLPSQAPEDRLDDVRPDLFDILPQEVLRRRG
jgi:hypothetical protein